MGDLLHVACDAWMLPVGSRSNVRHYWLEADPNLQSKVDFTREGDFWDGNVRALPLKGWKSSAPLPVITMVDGIATSDGLDYLRQSVTAFIEVGAKAARLRIRHEESTATRPIPLLGMPLLGTQGAGAGMHRGLVVREILAAAQVAAVEHDVDVVLVLNDAKSYALAQELRKTLSSWPELQGNNSALLERAKELAELAKTGSLVPFMGAGVSVSAGGPTWAQLIHKLAIRAGLEGVELKSLTSASRDALDQAAYLREVYRQRSDHSDAADGGFGAAISEIVELPRYGLAPALLASLQSKQAISLNYDTLYETAVRDTGATLTIIPSDDMEPSRRWLLKLHGSVTDPSTIVLTRDDYLGYSSSREALSAIVKANLITHHLLFVGFGLRDDHFHQIIHDVRRALPSHTIDGTGFATALTLQEDPLDATLWRGQLDLIALGDAEADVTASARRLEIFLDAMLAYSVDSHSYLLAQEFESSISESDHALREQLLLLSNCLTPKQRAQSGAWPAVERLLSELGLAQATLAEPWRTDWRTRTDLVWREEGPDSPRV